MLPQSLDEDECLYFEWRPLDMEHVVSFAPSSADVEISGIDTLNQEAKKKSEKNLQVRIGSSGGSSRWNFGHRDLPQ